MGVLLPTVIRQRVGTPKLRDFGADLTPPFGGEVQRFSRLGARFSVSIMYPPMEKHVAEDLIGALVDASTTNDTVIVTMPMAPLAASVGSPAVSGGGQAGAVLDADGFSGGLVRRGALFSFEAGGRHYLHMVRQAVTPSGGAASLAIGPMLRAQPADGADLDFAAPKLEGFIGGQDIEWDVDDAMHYGLSLTVFENK